MRRRVAIIGGGVSGLAAAHQLHQIAPEVEICLLEAGPRLGGVIQTINKDGFLIEGAADNFITTTPSAVQLCQSLGLGDELIPTNTAHRGAMVLSRGKLEPIPPGFMVMAPSRIWPLFSSRILSPMGKLRSAVELFVPPKRDVADESLRSFVCRRFGQEMFDRLVQPLVGGIYTADPNRLSVAATMPRFLEMERQHGSLIRGMMSQRLLSRFKQRQSNKQAPKQKNPDGGGARYSQFMTLRGGMSRLINALADALPEQSIQLDSPVTKIEPNSDHGSSSSDGASIRRWKLHLGEDQSKTLQADAVIMAAPARHAARMMSDLDSLVAKELRSIEYASCAVVSLAFRRDQVEHCLDSFGFVVPHIEDHFILSCSFSSVKYEGRAPEGTVLMRVFIGGACQANLLKMTDTQLKELAHWELIKLLGIEGEPLMRHVTRQMQAMPQYHVGHQDRIARIDQRLQQHPGLAIAGNCIGGVGVPGCIESGQKAAASVAEFIATVDQASTTSEVPDALAKESISEFDSEDSTMDDSQIGRSEELAEV